MPQSSAEDINEMADSTLQQEAFAPPLPSSSTDQLEMEISNLRQAYQILQGENDDLKLKLQTEQETGVVNDPTATAAGTNTATITTTTANDATEAASSIATAAAAAQLDNYQQALNLSESHKQQTMAENEHLKAKLIQLGVDVDAYLAVATVGGNDGTSNGIGMVEGDEVTGDETMPVPVHHHHHHDMTTAAAAAAAIDHHAAAGNNPLDISAAEAEALAAVDATTAHHHHHHHHQQQHHSHSHVLISNSGPPPTPTTGLSSRSDEKWEQHFQRLAEYQNSNGNCLVPTSTELGRWLCRQRHNHRYKGLKEDRKIRLLTLDPTCLGEHYTISAVGTTAGTNQDEMKLDEDGNPLPNTPGQEQHTDPQQQHQQQHVGSVQISSKTKYNLAYESKLHAKWNFYFQQLVQYKEEHGHCNFPTMNGSLGRWISRQRTLYRSQKLKADRFEKLKDMGFAFEDATALEFKNKLDVQWEKMHDLLVEHRERTGHCFDVPEDMPLGKWLYRQRWLYRHGNLRDDRAKKLLGIGFEDKKVTKKDIMNEKRKKRKRMSEGEEDVVEEEEKSEESNPLHIVNNGSILVMPNSESVSLVQEMDIVIESNVVEGTNNIDDSSTLQGDATKVGPSEKDENNEGGMALDQMMEETLGESAKEHMSI